MHEAALARAAIPAPTVVLGMLLRPLSCGHILALSADDTVERVLSGTVAPQQLTAAVLACCQDWESATGIAHDRLLSLKLWLWKRRVASAAVAHAKRLAKGLESAGYFQQEAAKFKSYLIAGSDEFPASDAPRPDRQSASRQPGSPFILRLNQWLVSSLRISEAAAWDYPFALAKMRWECHWEQEGGFDVSNEQDESFNSFIREREMKSHLEAQ